MGRLFPEGADEETKRRIWEEYKGKRQADTNRSTGTRQETPRGDTIDLKEADHPFSGHNQGINEFLRVFRGRAGRIIIALVLIGIFSFFIYDASGYSAYRAAKGFIFDYLKCPTTAKFQSYRASSISKDASGSNVTVEIVVDAQNGFGAMVRLTVVVKMEKSGGSYRLVDLYKLK